MIIGVLKEKDDTRVAITPDMCKRLADMVKNNVLIERNAGELAFYFDSDYEKVNAKISTREEILKNSDLLVSISPLNEKEYAKVKNDAVYVSMFASYQDENIYDILTKDKKTCFSLDMIPRSTRAQAMDVLSSMASISGYKAVLKAGDLLPRYMPMLTTSAGSIPPSKVLIIGAGVAGLQAVATARRNGAMVEAFDTRLAAKEEVESLGAKFVMVEGAKDDKDAGGYAVEQSEEYKNKQRELIKEKATKADIIITTAQLRGRPAPKIITKDIVENMPNGAIIIDLASSTGGNCELSEDNKIIKHNTITILGNSALMKEMPMDASRLFAKNATNFLQLMLDNGTINISFEDDILDAACLVFEGQRHNNK